MNRFNQEISIRFQKNINKILFLIHLVKRMEMEISQMNLFKDKIKRYATNNMLEKKLHQENNYNSIEK